MIVTRESFDLSRDLFPLRSSQSLTLYAAERGEGERGASAQGRQVVAMSQHPSFTMTLAPTSS